MKFVATRLVNGNFRFTTEELESDQARKLHIFLEDHDHDIEQQVQKPKEPKTSKNEVDAFYGDA